MTALQVIRDLPDYGADNLFKSLSTLSYLFPFPSTGMTILCWDRALELLPFCSIDAFTPLLRAMVRLSPGPPKRFADAAYEKCDELVPEMNAKSLSRALYWLYRNGQDGNESLVQVLVF